MKLSIYKENLNRRVEDLLASLEVAISTCPDDLWNNESIKPRYWYLLYHALFFLDLHLSDSPKGFLPPAPFAIIGLNLSGKDHDRAYSKSDMQIYLAHDRKKALSKMESLTETGLLKPCGFPWLEISIKDLLEYIIASVNEYAMQIGTILHQQEQ